MIEEILNCYPDLQLVTPDGLDDACIGFSRTNECLVYSQEKIIELLHKDGMTREEAHEWFDFNIQGAYMGPHTPMYIETEFDGFAVDPAPDDLKVPGIHTSVQTCLDDMHEVQLQIGNQTFRLAPVGEDADATSDQVASWYKYMLDKALYNWYNLLISTSR